MRFSGQAKKIFGSHTQDSIIISSKEKYEAFSIGFVCTANICRSAYAHYALLEKLNGIDLGIKVSSAGVLALVGEPMDPRMASIYRETYSANFNDHKASQISTDFINHNNLILVMDKGQRRNLLKEYPSAFPKVFLLTEFIELAKTIDNNQARTIDLTDFVRLAHQARGKGILSTDIDDPFRRSDSIYRRVCNEIDFMIENLFLHLKTNLVSES